MNFKRSEFLIVLAIILSVSGVKAEDPIEVKNDHLSRTFRTSMYQFSNLGTGDATFKAARTSSIDQITTDSGEIRIRGLSSEAGLKLSGKTGIQTSSRQDVLLDQTGTTGLNLSLGLPSSLDITNSFWLTEATTGEFGSATEIDFNNGKDSVKFNSDDFLGCERPGVSDQSLMEFADKTNWPSCFDKKVSGKDSTEQETFHSEAEVCECLRKSPIKDIQDIMNDKLFNNRKMAVSAKEKLKKVPQTELNNVLNGVFFHAFSSTDDDSLAMAYANNLYKKGDESDITGVPSGSELKYMPAAGLMKDSPPSEGQCVSPRDFMVMQQRPSGKVAELLSKPMSSSTWDYKELLRQQDKILGIPYVDRDSKKRDLLLIKEKLSFLNKNPLAKYALSLPASPENDQLKSKIYKTTQMLGTTECQNPFSDCSSTFKGAMAEILRDDKVLGAIRKEILFDHQERTKRKLNKPIVSPIPKDIFTHDKVVDEFVANYNLTSPDDCTSASGDVIGCVYSYSAYCKTLDKYKDHISSMNSDKDEDLLDNLDELIEDDFNPDPKTNKRYQEFVKSFCDTPRKKSFRASNISETLAAPRESATFSQFVADYCKDGVNNGCDRKSTSDYALLRSVWMKMYADDSQQLSSLRKMRVLVNNKSMAAYASGKTSKEVSSKTETVVANNGLNSEGAESTYLAMSKDYAKSLDRGPSLLGAHLGDALEEQGVLPSAIYSGPIAPGNTQSAINDPSPSFDDMSMNFASGYSNLSQASSAVQNPSSAETPKVEQMSDEKKQELLQDWQKQYNEWKESKGDDMSAADRAQDTSLRQEIASLRALLAQQQELSQQQYKLLNDAIAAKSKPVESSQTEVRPQEVRKPQSQFASAAVKASSEEETEAGRGPASVKETVTAGGAGSGSLSRAALSNSAVRKSAGSATDNSSDSLAREQAKLVNMRRYSDGSITIETAGNGATQGNAITVPVSDEQYRILQSNPAGLNLNQIERSIPKEQIAKLENKGEITILLQNGSNPPFEVKVEKKDNRLVYSLKDKNGKDQAPVRRVYTRQALELQLKVQQ